MAKTLLKELIFKKTTKAEIESGTLPDGKFYIPTDDTVAFKSDLDTKQDKGDYATNTALTQGLATKQPVGNYATEEELTQGLAGKADKATTLAGYGITDAYTKAQVDSALSGKLDATGTAARATADANGNIITETYATNTALQEGLAGKADASSIPTVNNPQITITQGGVEKGSFTLNQSGAETINLDSGGGSGLDIGDIVYTTRTDNELSGKVECNGAQYNFADVNGGNNNIKALLDANKIAYISIADYESAISSKGWCDKFGYDSGATSFRVPKLTPYIVQKENIPVNLSIDTIAGGTYNVSHTIDGKATNLNASLTNTSGNDVKTTYGDGRGVTRNILSKVTIPDKDINGEASINLSNIALQGRIMVQLFNGTTDEAVATCTGVLADVAGLKQTTDGMIDYVIESQEPTSTNGYTWYRLYKSGLVEQGGQYTGNAKSIDLPIEMVDKNYQVFFEKNSAPSYWATTNLSSTKNSTTNFSIVQYGDTASILMVWQVSGMSAQGA